MDQEGRSPEEHAADLHDHSLRALKERVAGAIAAQLRPIREVYLEMTKSRAGQQRLIDVANAGAESARQNAQRTMGEVYKAVGMR